MPEMSIGGGQSARRPLTALQAIVPPGVGRERLAAAREAPSWATGETWPAKLSLRRRCLVGLTGMEAKLASVIETVGKSRVGLMESGTVSLKRSWVARRSRHLNSRRKLASGVKWGKRWLEHSLSRTVSEDGMDQGSRPLDQGSSGVPGEVVLTTTASTMLKRRENRTMMQMQATELPGKRAKSECEKYQFFTDNGKSKTEKQDLSLSKS